MSRNLSISENPFVWGFRWYSLEFTDKYCGLKKLRYPLPTGNDYDPPKPVADEYDKKNYTPLTRNQKGAYHLGRTIRIMIAIPGSIADLTMQMAQIIFMTIEFSTVKSESVLTNKRWDDCLTLDIMDIIGPNFWIARLRNITTVHEPTIVARYFGYVGECDYLPSISSIYREKLCRALFN